MHIEKIKSFNSIEDLKKYCLVNGYANIEKYIEQWKEVQNTNEPSVIEVEEFVVPPQNFEELTLSVESDDEEL